MLTSNSLDSIPVLPHSRGSMVLPLFWEGPGSGEFSSDWVTSFKMSCLCWTQSFCSKVRRPVAASTALFCLDDNWLFKYMIFLFFRFVLAKSKLCAWPRLTVDHLGLSFSGSSDESSTSVLTLACQGWPSISPLSVGALSRSSVVSWQSNSQVCGSAVSPLVE